MVSEIRLETTYFVEDFGKKRNKMVQFKNGGAARVKRAVKGPYKKTDPGWWNKQAGTLWDKTATRATNKWKWIRL